MSSVSLLESLAPEMASVSTDTKETFLELAANMHTASQWRPNSYPSAMAYFAAHLLTKAGAAASSPSAASATDADVGGPVASKREGDLAIGYAAAAMLAQAATAEEAELMTTKYGRLYLVIRGRQPTAHLMVVGPAASSTDQNTTSSS